MPNRPIDIYKQALQLQAQRYVAEQSRGGSTNLPEAARKYVRTTSPATLPVQLGAGAPLAVGTGIVESAISGFTYPGDVITGKEAFYPTTIGEVGYNPTRALFTGFLGQGGGPGLASGIRHKWYSPLEEALRTGKAGKFDLGANPKASALATLLKKGGVSKQELQYSGLLDKLAELGEKGVTRQELLDYVVAHKTLEGVGKPQVLGDTVKHLPAFHKKRTELMKKRDELAEQYRTMNYSKWKLPLTEERRARLDQLNTAIDRYDKLIKSNETAFERVRGLGDQYGPATYGENINLKGYLPNTYQERLFHYTPEGGLRYVEPHMWPANKGENMMMFTRGHDRPLINGQVSKHLDEIQSEWHKAGGKEGYEKGIPDAPFKHDWFKLGFKEWVDSAVVEGKDAVTWSTGEILSKRYNKLSTKFDWSKITTTGDYRVRFWFEDRHLPREFSSLKEIEGFAGANVARIIAQQEKAAKPQANMIIGEGASGDFLVGGKFYEDLYDKALVKFVKQEYGVEPKKVQTPLISKSDADALLDALKQNDFNTANTVADSVRNSKKPAEVWYLELTPELKQRILQHGQRIAKPNLKDLEALSKAYG